MKDAYVKFETAQRLKNKGFDWNIRQYYALDSKTNVWELEYDDNEGNYNTYGENLISAPTQQMACRWLRGKQIDILPDCSLVDRKYSFHIINRYKSGGEIIHSDEMYDKYEDVIEAALEYCLTNLI